MRKWHSSILIVAVIGSTTTVARAAPDKEATADWKRLLREDSVVVRDKKFVSESYQLLTIAKSSKTAQFKVYSEAPADGAISRDNFVAITSTVQFLHLLPIILVMQAANEKAGANGTPAITFKDLEAPIGKVDVEINIYMTSLGIQIEVKGEKTERQTITWDDWFAE